MILNVVLVLFFWHKAGILCSGASTGDNSVMEKKPKISVVLNWMPAVMLVTFLLPALLPGAWGDHAGKYVPYILLLFGFIYLRYLSKKPPSHMLEVASSSKELLTPKAARAFLLSPILSAVLIVFMLAPLHEKLPRMFSLGDLSFGGVFISIVIALPFYLAIARRTKVQLWHCLLAGLVLGLIMSLAISNRTTTVVLGTADGLLTAFIFWLIGIKERKKPK